MNVNDLNTSLSPGQAQFVLMLEEKASYLMPLFDFDERVYLSEKVEAYFGVASHGQRIMASFFLGIWRHENAFNFDLIEAAQTLDENNMKIITDWLNNPFWP